MSIRKGGDGIGTRKNIPNPRPNRTKDKDEDLLLFRELHKREKDHVVSLLAPVSDDFEANGYALNGMAPTGKKGAAYDPLGEGGKNDYDWLKTPPATPLFPSLEMENGPELVTQREIPIVQPLSRFAGNLAVENGSIRPTKSTGLKPILPPRYSASSGRPSISTPEKKNIKSAPVVNQKTNQSYSDLNLGTTKKASSTVKPVDNREPNWNLLASNLSKSMGIGMDSSTKATKQKSRGVSPVMRSKLPAQIQELSDETPSNLRTDGSTSAYRGRATASQQNPSVSQKRPESVTKTRRQSCSPGTTRGSKQDGDGNLGSEKDRTQQANREQVLGSRMLDRFLNSRMSSSDDRKPKIKLNASMNEGSDARKSNIEERRNTTKFNTSMNEGPGFGRLMSKSSLDMALRHMEFQRDSGSKTKNGIIAGRRSVSVSKRTTSGL
ncbi:uncharacterized protein [Coffea arabica]|uniref:Uncharacterized protein n=1 Tax=Coffea arabica TaxID=13443 RepID=A0ABM4VLC8_COFAR|nr:uncharacterized protein LOC113707613 [Coffea arabica]XP_027087710.1 uncharacterized protein LOC113709205 [Coffea arabica]